MVDQLVDESVFFSPHITLNFSFCCFEPLLSCDMLIMRSH